MFTKRIITRFVFTILMIAALFFTSLGITPVHAAGITVNTNIDEITTNGHCSLREAIINANTNAAVYPDCATGFGTDTIAFAGNYTITLAGAELPVVTSEIIINGNGAGNTIIQASTCNPVTLPGGCSPVAYRIFAVSSTGNLTLNSMTVRHGWCNDPCEAGGGINNTGTLTVTNSIFSGNRAFVWGGGIYNTDTLTVTNSIFSGNSVAGSGAGIYNTSSGTLTITNSTIQGNTAGIINSGGGLYNFSGIVTVTNSTLSGNSAALGGGIFNYDGDLTVTNSTLSGNSAGNNGGGIYNSSNSNLGIYFSTLSGNIAAQGGGIYNDGNLWLGNATVSGNEAYDYGGGIYSDGSAWIHNSTIAFNVLVEGTNLGAGGIDGDVALYNTLVAGNTRAISSTYRDCSGTVFLGGINVLWDQTNCTRSPSSTGYFGSLFSLNELGPLQDNGGPTWTHALIPIEEGSRVIDAGDNTICANWPINNLDQRGVARPQGSHCDVGAFEYQEPPTFADVPREHPFWRYIEAFYDAGITAGCNQSPLQYCPQSYVTRGEMAVFIERAMGNSAPNPSPTGMFADVPPGNPFKPFIEELYNDGITAGCGLSPLRYCPQSYVTRGEMAVFIERAIGNSAPNPSPTGMFADVLPGNPFKPFIEELYNDGITAGCGQSPLRYCPQNNVTRGEMAVFIVRAFGIPLP